MRAARASRISCAVNRSVLSVRFTLVLVFVLAFLSGNVLLAQQATAVLTGAVKDASGAVIVGGAKVTLKNTQTNATRNATTDKDGGYLFNLVPIGTYDLKIEEAGFDTYIRKGITLEINQNARLDVALRIGTASQVVEVAGDVTQVDTVSATLGQVETTERIQNLAAGRTRHDAIRPSAGGRVRSRSG